MNVQQITGRIIKATAFCVLGVFFVGCHFTSTGTMVYDYSNEKIINFTPAPALPGSYREVIIHSSPKHSCFFTMQSVRENNRQYILIRKKDFTGKELSSYKVMCIVFPCSLKFAISPDNDRICITGCYLPGAGREISYWCDLPEVSSEIEIHPQELPSVLGKDMLLVTPVLRRNHEFLSKDILLVILKRELPETSSLANKEAYLGTLDLAFNEYHIIKQLKTDDGTDFLTVTAEVEIKVNENGLAAILADRQLFIYDYREKKLSEKIRIGKFLSLSEPDFLEMLDFSWISQDEICIWNRHDDMGRYVIYSLKTENYQAGKLNARISDWFTPSVCVAGWKIVDLHSNTKKNFPKSWGSGIYEAFWLREGLLGFTCDY